MTSSVGNWTDFDRWLIGTMPSAAVLGYALGPKNEDRTEAVLSRVRDSGLYGPTRLRAEQLVTLFGPPSKTGRGFMDYQLSGLTDLRYRWTVNPDGTVGHGRIEIINEVPISAGADVLDTVGRLVPGRHTEPAVIAAIGMPEARSDWWPETAVSYLVEANTRLTVCFEHGVLTRTFVDRT